MRRILIICCALLAAGIVNGAELRAGGGFGWLLSPSLDDINTIPTVDRTRGGGSITIQMLCKRMSCMRNMKYGAEVSFLRSYRYEYHVPATTEITLNSFPLLALCEYSFVREKRIEPFMQAGIGFTHNRLITEIDATTDTALSNDFTLMLGPGFTVKLNEKWKAGILANYYLIFTGGDYTKRFNLSGVLSYLL